MCQEVSIDPREPEKLEETQTSQKIQTLTSEVQMHFAEPAISKKEYPLKMEGKEGCFPTLSKLERSLLHIPSPPPHPSESSLLQGANLRGDNELLSLSKL